MNVANPETSGLATFCIFADITITIYDYNFFDYSNNCRTFHGGFPDVQ